ncbi:MAG: hypothetical protein G01um101433_481 [Parcubacteria group bacterium Gr01-1014_33]|nr:MAG: hypothetical protein G01um101433_481 [Parcubacteria group bacterium Gr01-1014_33]
MTYNQTPFKLGGLNWEEGHAAREDARARDETLHNILKEIQLRTNTIQKIERRGYANFVITVDSNKSGNTTIYPTDIVQRLQGLGYTVFEDRGFLL